MSPTPAAERMPGSKLRITDKSKLQPKLELAPPPNDLPMGNEGLIFHRLGSEKKAVDAEQNPKRN